MCFTKRDVLNFLIVKGGLICSDDVDLDALANLAEDQFFPHRSVQVFTFESESVESDLTHQELLQKIDSAGKMPAGIIESFLWWAVLPDHEKNDTPGVAILNSDAKNERILEFSGRCDDWRLRLQKMPRKWGTTAFEETWMQRDNTISFANKFLVVDKC